MLGIVVGYYLNDVTLRLVINNLIINRLNIFITLLGYSYECACVCAYYSGRTASKNN